jgi:nicotinamide riboside kinase
MSYSRLYDLYILADTDIPWEPDPFQREGPEVREMLHRQFQNELNSRRLPFVLVSGSVEERIRQAVTAIDAWLGVAFE